MVNVVHAVEEVDCFAQLVPVEEFREGEQEEGRSHDIVGGLAMVGESMSLACNDRSSRIAGIVSFPPPS